MAESSFSTPKEQLAQVEEAIKSILQGGQSYKIGTRQLTRADLKQLEEMRRQLLAVVSQDDSPLFNDTYRAVFEGR